MSKKAKTKQLRIDKSSTTERAIRVELSNDKIVTVVFNDGYVSLMFDGLGGRRIVCTPLSSLGQDEKFELECSNYVNIFY